MSKKLFAIIALCLFATPVLAGDGDDPSYDCFMYGDSGYYAIEHDCQTNNQCKSYTGYSGSLCYDAIWCTVPIDMCDTVTCGEGTYYDGDGCVSCPSWGDISPILAGQSAVGSTAISDCYIQKTEEAGLSDSTGTGVKRFNTSNCYYSN